MTRRVRLGALLVGAVTTAALIFGAVAWYWMLGSQTTNLPPQTAAALRTRLLWLIVLAAASAAVAAWLLARWLGRALDSLRAVLLARARGDLDTAPPAAPRFLEMRELLGAAERLGEHVRRREVELERDRDDVNVLLDSISEGILQLDGHGRIVRTNLAAQHILGLDAPARGQPIATRVRQAELRGFLEAAAAGTPQASREVTIEDRRLLLSARPLRRRSERQQSAGTVIAMIDLTELRRLEGVRRDFVANVSHELKTPLTSLRGYAETLLAEPDLAGETRQQFLEVMYRSADRLHRIVDELLDLSRLESGGWRPVLQPVDPADIVADAWAACQESAERKHIAFTVAGAHHPVLADAGGLRQVLANLFENAIRYTPDGGRIEVRITPGGNGSRNYIMLDIRDNGSGIPSDALPRIFERFYRVDPARSRADGGTGLGLSIVKHLVESMGGDVRAESQLGKGTAIRLRLPAA